MKYFVVFLVFALSCQWSEVDSEKDGEDLDRWIPKRNFFESQRSKDLKKCITSPDEKAHGAARKVGSEMPPNTTGNEQELERWMERDFFNENGWKKLKYKDDELDSRNPKGMSSKEKQNYNEEELDRWVPKRDFFKSNQKPQYNYEELDRWIPKRNFFGARRSIDDQNINYGELDIWKPSRNFSEARRSDKAKVGKLHRIGAIEEQRKALKKVHKTKSPSKSFNTTSKMKEKDALHKKAVNFKNFNIFKEFAHIRDLILKIKSKELKKSKQLDKGEASREDNVNSESEQNRVTREADDEPRVLENFDEINVLSSDKNFDTVRIHKQKHWTHL